MWLFVPPCYSMKQNVSDHDIKMLWRALSLRHSILIKISENTKIGLHFFEAAHRNRV